MALSRNEIDRFVAAWNGGVSMGDLCRDFKIGAAGVCQRVTALRKRGYVLIKQRRGFARRAA